MSVKGAFLIIQNFTFSCLLHFFCLVPWETATGFYCNSKNNKKLCFQENEISRHLLHFAFYDVKHSCYSASMSWWSVTWSCTVKYPFAATFLNNYISLERNKFSIKTTYYQSPQDDYLYCLPKTGTF